MQLSTHLADLRLLLKDASGQFWSDSDLDGYINRALKKTVARTKALRQLTTVALVAQQETYTLPTVSIDPGSGAADVQSFDVANISVIFGSERVQLRPLPFIRFNATLRALTGWYGVPFFCSIQGQKTVYLGPVPDQAYSSEWDVYVPPPTLAATGDDDGLIWPYTEPVKYYAAYLAQLERQRDDKAAKMLELWEKEVVDLLNDTQTESVYGG